MYYFFVFLLCFRFIAIAGSAIYSYKIARMPITPTWIWGIFCASFCLSLGRLIMSSFFFNDLVALLDAYTKTNVIADQLVSACAVFLIFFGVLSVYYNLKLKFKNSL